jgi:uncharacterized OB-fold protein
MTVVDATARAIDPGLFTWPSDEPRLIGSRCRSCGLVNFPAADGCSRCTANDTEEHLLASTGELWTWTVQGFRPKSPPYEGPVDFTPYLVGYVALPGEVKVETLIVGTTADDVEIGMPMELVIIPFESSVTNEPLVTFAFQPAAPSLDATATSTTATSATTTGTTPGTTTTSNTGD